ncbi:MAG: rhodanese-like domain-containing protein [Bdellovibrionales bacterium]
MISITCLYKFQPVPAQELTDRKTWLESLASRHKIKGLVLIGTEGINFTVSGKSPKLQSFKSELVDQWKIQDPEFKDSEASHHPFHEFVVKIKDEIVHIGDTSMIPVGGKDGHISPKEWNAKIQSGAVVVDTRNDYEYEIGRFKGALNLNLKEFHEFPDVVANTDLPKDKEILIYCTGGIRCEKAILAMRQQGYDKVYQLDGGILKYLEECPDQEFEGECFVFDYRVAVDQRLQPSSRYKLCVHCGQASDREVKCSLCGTTGIVCHHCQDAGINTCSKNCAHHVKIGSRSKRPHIQELSKRAKN